MGHQPCTQISQIKRAESIRTNNEHILRILGNVNVYNIDELENVLLDLSQIDVFDNHIFKLLDKNIANGLVQKKKKTNNNEQKRHSQPAKLNLKQQKKWKNFNACLHMPIASRLTCFFRPQRPSFFTVCFVPNV